MPRLHRLAYTGEDAEQDILIALSLCKPEEIASRQLPFWDCHRAFCDLPQCLPGQGLSDLSAQKDVEVMRITQTAGLLIYQLGVSWHWVLLNLVSLVPDESTVTGANKPDR
jgi:hypothetical protein